MTEATFSNTDDLGPATQKIDRMNQDRHDREVREKVNREGAIQVRGVASNIIGDLGLGRDFGSFAWYFLGTEPKSGPEKGFYPPSNTALRLEKMATGELEHKPEEFGSEFLGDVIQEVDSLKLGYGNVNVSFDQVPAGFVNNVFSVEEPALLQAIGITPSNEERDAAYYEHYGERYSRLTRFMLEKLRYLDPNQEFHESPHFRQVGEDQPFDQASSYVDKGVPELLIDDPSKPFVVRLINSRMVGGHTDVGITKDHMGFIQRKSPVVKGFSLVARTK